MSNFFPSLNLWCISCWHLCIMEYYLRWAYSFLLNAEEELSPWLEYSLQMVDSGCEPLALLYFVVGQPVSIHQFYYSSLMFLGCIMLHPIFRWIQHRRKRDFWAGEGASRLVFLRRRLASTPFVGAGGEYKGKLGKGNHRKILGILGLIDIMVFHLTTIPWTGLSQLCLEYSPDYVDWYQVWFGTDYKSIHESNW